jgi:hypothetical protein
MYVISIMLSGPYCNKSHTVIFILIIISLLVGTFLIVYVEQHCDGYYVVYKYDASTA